MKTKKCSGKYSCGKIKTIDNFEKRKDTGNYRNLCKDCRKIHQNLYRSKNKKKLSKYHQEYRKNNSKRIAKIKKKYNDKTTKQRSESGKVYRVKNQNQINKQRRNKRKSCLKTRLSENLRSRLWQAIKTSQKSGSAVKDLGCSVEELKIHLEKQFYSNHKTGEKMTWDNYGLQGWHIDHIIPLSSFDLTNRKQFLKACHYTNLQPLWADDNLNKGNKV